MVIAIEIVSPGTKTTDRKHKPVEYANAGVSRYWRVEIEPVEVHTFVLGADGRYESTGVFKPGDTMLVPGLEWAAIDVSELDRA